MPSPLIFTNGAASDPPSPLHDSSEKNVTTEGNPTPRNNPLNPVPNAPDDPDLDPSFLNYSLSDSSDSSDYEYYKQRRRAKKNKN